MKFIFLISVSSLMLFACMKGEKVDLIIHNAKIHSMDENQIVYEAIAIKNGEIVELGPERQILNKFSADEIQDAKGKEIYPGFTDSHGHLLSLMEQKLNLNLTGSESFEEILFKTEKYNSPSKKFILGRGWDQSLWENTTFPNNEKLNQLFPNKPVILIRVDGHAALVNDFLLQKAKITKDTKIEGGKTEVLNGKMTGLILDNTITEVLKYIPNYSKKDKQIALIEIQEELFQYGITSVHEAGINFEDIDLLKSLYHSKKFQLGIYAMLYPSEKNIAFAKKNGKYQFKNLRIQSFKIVGDGSLGSRGACLKEAYSDEPNTHGFLTTSLLDIKQIAKTARLLDYQMNTHAIGDSTNKILIEIMKETFLHKKDHRWRMEHAQVLSLNDIEEFGKFGIIPSVQPTHAVSDMRWAEDRIGKHRLDGAYAYKKLLEVAGLIAFGTDFPVESFNPFLTIHAAVNRKNEKNEPKNGFLTDDKVSFEDCLKAMTIWPAFASFQETNDGSLEKGKNATFVVLEYPLNKSEIYEQNFANQTYIKGKKVYSIE